MKRLFTALARIFRDMVSFSGHNRNQKTPERLAFCLDTSASKALRDLAELTETTNFAKLLRIALATYNMLADHVRQGGTIILRNKDGSEQAFDPINFDEVKGDHY